MNERDVQVSGPATVEDVAAVLAALRVFEKRAVPASRYERWRRERLAAVRDNR